MSTAYTKHMQEIGAKGGSRRVKKGFACPHVLRKALATRRRNAKIKHVVDVEHGNRNDKGKAGGK